MKEKGREKGRKNSSLKMGKEIRLVATIYTRVVNRKLLILLGYILAIIYR